MYNQLICSPKVPYCTLSEEECVERVAGEPTHCLVSCEGLYANIEQVTEDLDLNENSAGIQMLLSIFDFFNSHKESFAKNIVFDSASESLSKCVL